MAPLEGFSCRSYVVNSPNFLAISYIFLDVQLFQNSIGGDREFWGKSAVNEIG
jgi:hypothetical protein